MVYSQEIALVKRRARRVILFTCDQVLDFILTGSPHFITGTMVVRVEMAACSTIHNLAKLFCCSQPEKMGRTLRDPMRTQFQIPQDDDFNFSVPFFNGNLL